MHRLAIPTGPIHSFVALPFPLPQEQQDKLRALASAIKAARTEHLSILNKPHSALRRKEEEESFDKTKAAVMDSDMALSIATLEMREKIGVEFTRREFLLKSQIDAHAAADRKHAEQAS